MFGRLLVGLDGTVQADVALEQAVVLARRFGGTVVVAYVREPGAAVDAGQPIYEGFLRVRPTVPAPHPRFDTRLL